MDDNTPNGAADARPFHPAYVGTNRTAVALAAAAIGLALAGGGYYWWQQQRGSGPAPAAEAASAATPAPAPAPSTATASPSADPVIQHPIDTAAAPAPPRSLPTLDQADAAVSRALIDWLGAKSVAAALQTDGFVRRVVATVDGLGRTHAAPRLWPVVPSPGRFTVERAGDGEQISAANSARYDAFVAFATSIDPARAAAFYKQHYPLFQTAYQELGYPRGYFNDRLVEVIDQLLATPEPAAPVAVRLTEVKGPLTPDRPWVRYEFADPTLQSLSAGSKMLLRVGNEHARQLKAKLRAFRSEIATKRQ